MSGACRQAALVVRDDHAAMLRDATPFIDVRSPGEFARGAVPGAVNLPLLTDDERAAVGVRYKAEGREAALALGHTLVAGGSKRERIEAWRAFAARRPHAVFYCARGGLRSAIAQRWLAEAGAAMPRAEGGFKALRQACLATLEHARGRRFLLLGGRTGTGKTRLLHKARRHIDLEGLASHRGSAFGGLSTPQPAPVAFENALAATLLALPGATPIVLEDEGRTIGRLVIPAPVFNAMKRAPIVLLEAATAERVENILREYVLAADRPAERLPAALARIERRLGGARHRAIAAQMAAAFDAGEPTRNLDAHRAWIQALLTHYYDPMYDHQLAGKTQRVVLRGDAEAVAAYVAEQTKAPVPDATGAVSP